MQEYGCFVDFGAKNDGLVHISELKNGFVENVTDVVAADQDVTVWIKSIDSEKGRISLTMKPPPTAEELVEYKAKEEEREAKFAARKAQQAAAKANAEKVKAIKPGTAFDGEVKSVQPFGAFVEIMEGIEGLVHVTEMSDDYNVEVSDFCKVGDTVAVKVMGIDGAKVKLTMKDKVDISAVVEEALQEVEAGAGTMEYAFKSKGITSAQFPAGNDKEKPAEKKAEKKEEPAGPPEPWETHETHDGNTYYWNRLTGETSWTLPEAPKLKAAAAPAPKKPKKKRSWCFGRRKPAAKTLVVAAEHHSHSTFEHPEAAAQDDFEFPARLAPEFPAPLKDDMVVEDLEDDYPLENHMDELHGPLVVND